MTVLFKKQNQDLFSILFETILLIDIILCNVIFNRKKALNEIIEQREQNKIWYQKRKLYNIIIAFIKSTYLDEDKGEIRKTQS